MDIKKQYLAYKERMLCKGFEFLTVRFEEFEETILHAKQEEKKNGRKHTKKNN